MSVRPVRCAAYTRKSSEEGLDQSFNSIQAQREACEAYIASQRHEGWIVLPKQYDDGGFSGGTLERPAVQQLLADIRSGSVDLVVVYKIDRLTRSLADFAKMVDVFDAHNASFVSVTQHFNTTTSMGRLTLNVLLSFAQFEREVTGERIRDKIAASKKKGMWMGGTVPVGYNAVDRRLVVNRPEADIVRSIFKLYLETGNVRLLKAKLDAAGIRSKTRTAKSGKTSGGLPFQPGAIYKILSSRVYLGEVPHKDCWYPGEHEAIVEPALFEKVQGALALKLDRRRKGVHAKEPSMLAGLVIDKDHNRLVPTHALKKGKRYRYYVSRPAKGAEPGSAEWITKTSVPANDLETLVVKAVSDWLGNPARIAIDLRLGEREADERGSLLRAAETYAEKLRQASPREQRELLEPCLIWISVRTEEVRIALRRLSTLRALGVNEPFDEEEDKLEEDGPMLSVAARLRRYGMEMRLVVNAEWATVESPEPDPHVVRSLARAHGWWIKLQSGQASSITQLAQAERVSSGYVAKLLRAALLAPDIVEELTYRELAGITSKALLNPIAGDWRIQRNILSPLCRFSTLPPR